MMEEPIRSLKRHTNNEPMPDHERLDRDLVEIDTLMEEFPYLRVMVPTD